MIDVALLTGEHDSNRDIALITGRHDSNIHITLLTGKHYINRDIRQSGFRALSRN